MNSHWKDWCWSSGILVTDANSQLTGKVPDAGKHCGQKKRESEDEIAGWHHQCNGHELGQTSGDSEGPGGLAHAAHRVTKESDTTGWLNNILGSLHSWLTWIILPNSKKCYSTIIQREQYSKVQSQKNNATFFVNFVGKGHWKTMGETIRKVKSTKIFLRFTYLLSSISKTLPCTI